MMTTFSKVGLIARFGSLEKLGDAVVDVDGNDVTVDLAHPDYQLATAAKPPTDPQLRAAWNAAHGIIQPPPGRCQGCGG